VILEQGRIRTDKQGDMENFSLAAGGKFSDSGFITI